MLKAIIQSVGIWNVGRNKKMKEFIDKTSERKGTPLNRENMMAVQGFKNSTISIVENGNVTTVIETSDDTVYTTTVTENPDGSVTVVEVLEGEKTITKTTEISAEGDLISEVVS